jgi:flavin-dependent dehydrogenase
MNSSETSREKQMSEPTTVVGAGPAGLVAAATLARSGRAVRVFERSEEVGHRFSGDFQGLENWSAEEDVLDRLSRIGVEATFDHKPFYEVTFWDHNLRPTHAHSYTPLFYLVRRGPEPGTLDRALLQQAEAAGAEVLLGKEAARAVRGDIIAIGPRYADGLAVGYVFPTRLPDQAHCIVSETLAPAGYAYLLVWDGLATLATCLFRPVADWQEARRLTVDAFTRLVPDMDLDLDRARPFSGFGSVFGPARFSDEAGRLFVGEAAGLQDPEWGFGMVYAMESGFLVARSLVDGFDYAEAALEAFEPRREAALANRLIYESLPRAVVPWLLRRAASSRDLRAQIHRHWRPALVKSFIARVGWQPFARSRLHHRDRACHLPTCQCVWCTHGDHAEDRTAAACGESAVAAATP